MTRRRALACAGIAAASARAEFRDREAGRWNRTYSSAAPGFNTKPNAFLAGVVRGIAPGRALDLGMGQGRNTIYLAQQGWDVTGLDIADIGVEKARQVAGRLGLRIDARVQDADGFDFGQSQWDLIAVIYFAPRPYIEHIRQALKPGGVLVIEGFHRETLEHGHGPYAVSFETNELFHTFDFLRVLRYEDFSGPPDFGPGPTRLIRLSAQKG